MSLQIGYLDSLGHPVLAIRVTGTNPNAHLDVDAMIDTGFTGFLQLPISLALPLGLVLWAEGNYNLADGSTVTNFLAEGTVTTRPPSDSGEQVLQTAPESVEGLIVLGGDGALLGMEFLRSLDKWLLVGKSVFLLDSSELPIKI
jgi:predicted aspartyl protease